MGCRSSKPEEASPVVALCRERRDLIRAAGERRFALAAAHAAYFRALARVGAALDRFVQEGLAAAAAAEAAAAGASPVLTLPPSEGKGKSKPKIDGSERNGDNGDSGGGGAASSSSLPSISRSASRDSHLHSHSDSDHGEISEENGGIEVGAGGVPQGEAYGGGGGGGFSWSNPSYPFYPPYPPPYPPSYAPFSNVGNVIPNYHYMKSSSTKPTTVFQEPYTTYSNQAFVSYDYEDNYPIYGYSMGSTIPPVQDQTFYENAAPASPRREAKSTAPPPPPTAAAEGSSWDFFNLFNSYEQLFPGYDRSGYAATSLTSSPNSSEVREREGIPDLEDETEQETVKEAAKERKVTGSDSGKKGSSVGSSKGAAEHKEDEVNDEVVIENESIHSSEDSEARGSVKEEQEKEEVHVTKVKGVSFEDDTSLVSNGSRASKENVMSVHGTRDVAEVVQEIKEQFNYAASCGEEVSRILEVGRLRYRSRNKILRFILSRILYSMSLRSATSSRTSKSSPHSTGDMKQNMAIHTNSERVNDFELSNLTSVLDRLHEWEKKLYKEVKEEENLRVIYDREWKRLKALDENGAEAHEIDSTRASIKALVTRINIVIRSVNAISSRIHKLRDDELQPQLIELIQGLIRMWKFVLDCHRKQFQAMVESKAQNLIPKFGGLRSSASKATIELELELLNWASCFRDWIQTQKAYIEALNGWLLKWLLQEKEETPDGEVPFSPSRMGAPPVFITANDWCQTLERISENGVIDTMRAFAINVHSLWEKQDVEQHQKLKTEYLSKDFGKRLKSVQKEYGINGPVDVDKIAMILASNGPIDDRMVGLDALKKRLDEERAKHEEAVKQVREASATNLRAGLIPIFEALGNFTIETLKGYEGVRIPNVGGVT
ncbi:uncharacterized protein LOC109721166 [Ananas comosus]|uniref:Uncharacterized protein LOC109709529 n=1 Tax=Ananas comosus TaxID=4615 RepID=A0A6P5EV18_ANACO|nr:uncharacterized protein LOC109709529 [Ananas comosus]XP_020104198.1 uncharacterized protein LOC109721166 [Ananas comosus]